MSVFRYPADRAPVAVFVAMFAVDVAVYLLIDHPLLLLLYFGLGILPKAAVCAFNHHHQHLPTFKVEIFNRLLELMYALQTGVSSHAWVLHHSVGHHLNYLDQTKDESRWTYADGSKMGELAYSAWTTLTAYPRAWEVSRRHPQFRRVFVVMGLISLAVVCALVWYRPVPGLMVFVLVPGFSLFGTAWATYAHHAGRSTASHMVASNNMIQPLYNWWTGNLGYHTAHHFKPGVHWSKLKELHAEIAHQIPADAFVAPGWPWRLAGGVELPTAAAGVSAPTPSEPPSVAEPTTAS